MLKAPALRLQDLPPRWARFCLGIQSFAAQELRCDFSTQSCLVGVSGGADSTALLLITTLLCRLNGGSVQVAHLNHGLRAEAQDDQAFVSELCDAVGVMCRTETADVSALAAQNGMGLEEAGRAARYELFERERGRVGASVVLVAHQLNDLAEDQLMRLTRGSGWPALGGMAGFDPHRCLLRPLLLTPRAELEAFLTQAGCAWRVDETNTDRAATRNRIRHDLLPLFQAENPAFLSAAARLWRQARVDEAHWDAELREASQHLVYEPTCIFLPARVLKSASCALRQRLYITILERLGPGQALSESVSQLDGLWSAAASGKRVQFPGDKEARISKSGIRFRVIDRKKECG